MTKDCPEPNKYAPGTKVKACDIIGVVEEPDCFSNTEIVIAWETLQTYAYTVEWLDMNVEVIK